MRQALPDNVIAIHPRRPRATFCADCDPGCGRPFHVPYRADPRTGDILTPCPSCGRHALVEVARAGDLREIGA
jgi:hypothetical protein